MSFPYRKTLLIIGDVLEITGNITLVAAAIAGFLAGSILLCVFESESKPSSRKKDTEQDRDNTVIINYINIGDDRNYRARDYDNSDFYSDLLVSSAICSMIGIVLAIYFQISWVAITVVSLWAAAAALSYIGRALINYALTLPVPPVQASMQECNTKDDITPSATIKEKSVEMTTISNKDALYYQPTVARWAGYDNPYKSNGNRHPTLRSYH